MDDVVDGRWTSRPLPVSSFGSLKRRRSSDQRRARRRHCDAFKRFFFFSLLRLAQTKRAIHRAGIYCADKRPSSHARTHEQSYLRISNVGSKKKQKTRWPLRSTFKGSDTFTSPRCVCTSLGKQQVSRRILLTRIPMKLFGISEQQKYERKHAGFGLCSFGSLSLKSIIRQRWAVYHSKTL